MYANRVSYNMRTEYMYLNYSGHCTYCTHLYTEIKKVTATLLRQGSTLLRSASIICYVSSGQTLQSCWVINSSFVSMFLAKSVFSGNWEWHGIWTDCPVILVTSSLGEYLWTRLLFLHCLHGFLIEFPLNKNFRCDFCIFLLSFIYQLPKIGELKTP